MLTLQSLFRFFFDLENVALCEEVRFHVLVKFWRAAAKPFEGHYGVFDLFVTVVLQDLFELFVGRLLGPLVVPVDRL